MLLELHFLGKPPRTQLSIFPSISPKMSSNSTAPQTNDQTITAPNIKFPENETNSDTSTANNEKVGEKEHPRGIPLSFINEEEVKKLNENIQKALKKGKEARQGRTESKVEKVKGGQEGEKQG